jgi:hypothetical protein
MPSYEELKKELISVSELLKLFPPDSHELILKTLLTEFLQRSVSADSPVDVSIPPRKPSEAQTGARKKTVMKESFKIISNLDFAGGSGIPSFRGFHDEKKPRSNYEFNTLAVYYLGHMLKVGKISPDHIYTCYKEVARKIPGAFRQSLHDTSSSGGYIDTKDINNIFVTTRGENLVEHDLPRKTKESTPESSTSAEPTGPF